MDFIPLSINNEMLSGTDSIRTIKQMKQRIEPRENPENLFDIEITNNDDGVNVSR